METLSSKNRKVLAWRLQTSLDSDSFSEVVDLACEATGMDRVAAQDRAKLLSDNGAALISRPFGEAIRRWLKRRAAIEPIISHLKSDNGMDKNGGQINEY